MTDDAARLASEQPKQPPRQAKSLTIGAVCKGLQQEFPDISISKIRYLEDQKLVTPRRTPGGYRLYSPSDVSRLRTILRLQRDEYMPLAVIRQELASGRTARTPRRRRERGGAPARPTAAGRRGGCRCRCAGRLDVLARGRGRGHGRRAAPRPGARGLRDHQGRAPRAASASTTRPTARSSARCRSSRAYGVAGRNLRVFKSSAEREAALLNQILAPSLRSRNPERRREALDALENLAAVASHLKHLLLVRDLRRITG